MIDIKCCPSTLAEGFDTYSPGGRRVLFGGKKVSHILDFDTEKSGYGDGIIEYVNKISVSGVQEKFPAVTERGKIRISRDGERSTHILKPAPWDESLSERRQIPANEHLTMQIASRVYGIKTAANGLGFTPEGRAVYITRRFDILPDGTKIQLEDFASLTGRNENTGGTGFKYGGCYEDLARVIRGSVAPWMVDTERFFELVLFNYIYANGDGHMKNFSLIRRGEICRLAPAYDLVNTALHVTDDDFGLDGGLSPDIEKSDVMCRTGHPCRPDFERFGRKLGLPAIRLEKILDKYMTLPAQTEILTGRSFLSQKMKRKYLRVVRERIRRYTRKSG